MAGTRGGRGRGSGGATGKGFQPGQSGNPGGRPKEEAQVRVLAQQHTDAAIQTLARLMRKAKTQTVQVAAAVALLDRGWGRPFQSHEIKGTLSQAIQYFPPGPPPREALAAAAETNGHAGTGMGEVAL